MTAFLDQYSGLIYNYIGLVWIPIGLLMAHKPHRLLATLFIATCLMTLRLQVELMESIGRPTGFLPFISGHVYTRGLIVYSVIIALFLILARFSPRTQKTVFLAAGLSVYILTFCLSMFLMVI